jgi:HAD superfamily hydrolase (TIGR01509 family)
VSARLADILGHGPLLLDFDGPVCSVFASLPAPEVAAELVALLRAAGVDVPPAVVAEPDPLAVLRWTGEWCTPELTAAADDALCAQELRAVESAAPTPFSRESILAARAAGLPVAVVSNNSAGAISGYLSIHGLADYVAAIVGRPHARPDRMKPNPVPILNAARALGAEPAACVLVGDSTSDIEAARAAGAHVVGYANRPHKVEALRGADAVIITMAALADALTPMSPVSPPSPPGG